MYVGATQTTSGILEVTFFYKCRYFYAYHTLKHKLPNSVPVTLNGDVSALAQRHLLIFILVFKYMFANKVT